MDFRILLRLSAVDLVTVAVTATAIELSRRDTVPEASRLNRDQFLAGDPLRADLARCARIGEAGPRDPACLRTWMANRKRFLTPGSPHPQSPSGMTGAVRSPGSDTDTLPPRDEMPRMQQAPQPVPLPESGKEP